MDIIRKRKEIDSNDKWIVAKSVITFDEHPEVIGQLEIMKQRQESDASRYVRLHRDLEKPIQNSRQSYFQSKSRSDV